MKLDDDTLEKGVDADFLLGDGTEETVPRDIKCPDPVFDIGFHPSSPYLVVGRVSGNVDVHEYRRNDTRQIHTMKQHDGSVRGLEFSEDGRYLVTVGSDRHIKVFDCTSQTNLIDISPSDGGGTGASDFNAQEAAAFLDGGASDGIVKKTKRHGTKATSAGDILKQRRAAQQAAARPVNPHTAPISSVNICSETLVATGDDDGTIVIWDMRTSAPAHTYQEHADYVSQMLFFSEVDQLISTSGDTTMGCYSLRAGKLLDCSDPRKDELNSMVFIGATNDIVCGTPSGKLPIWKYGSWQRPFDVHASHPKEGDGLVAYNDNIFLTGAADGTVRVVQHYPTRSLLTHLGGHDRRHFPITRIRISNDRRMIAYSGEERYVQFQDIEFLGSEEELDKLRSRAEARYMAVIRRAQEEEERRKAKEESAGNNDDDDEDFEDDDDDNDSDDSSWTSDSQEDDDDDDDDEDDDDDDEEAVAGRHRTAGRRVGQDGGNNIGDDDDGEEGDTDRMRDRRRQVDRRQAQREQATVDDDEEPVLSRAEKRDRVAAAKWLKTAQKESVNFKREKSKKRVRGFWSGL